MATLSNDDAPGFKQEAGESYDQYWKRTEALMAQMMATANALPEGKYVGAILSFPIADGRAHYLVTKTKPLTLQHIGYMDGYQIPHAHVRGLNLDDVREHVRRAKGMAALFARPAASR